MICVPLSVLTNTFPLLITSRHD